MSNKKVNESIETALRELYGERERVEAAINKLEGLLETMGVRIPEMQRGARFAPVRTGKPRSRAGWTPAARDAAADRMRRWWEQRKADGKSGTRKRASGGIVRTSTRSRKGWTEEARAAAASRMKEYWRKQREGGVVDGGESDHEGDIGIHTGYGASSEMPTNS